MKFFEEISAIPRPSYHEEKIADYLCGFAESRGLECFRDGTDNVFIKLAATPGREGEDAVLLQGHTDMVCEKNGDVEHDFAKDGIRLYEKDGWIRAEGTTLGADDGVAVATMLYILDGAEGNLPSHPPIECLFTASEEVGMEGASNFDYSLVSATRMINMDSADERLIIAGCAGGELSEIIFEPRYEEAPKEALKVELRIKGLAGGHSGEDIDKGRANANKLMGRILLSLSKTEDFRLCKIEGGSKDNAIPREAGATVACVDAERFVKEVRRQEKLIKSELCRDDEGFALEVNVGGTADRAMTKDSSEKLYFLTATVQNGIFEMNRSIKGLVEFSRNLGVVSTAADGKVSLIFFARSPRESQMDFSTQQLDAYAKQLGMTHVVHHRYSGWEYAENSAIRKTYAQCFKNLYGEDVEVLAIHAGLECGIISQKLPNLDIISCGPVILDLHSPDEALNKASFERFFTVIKDVLSK